MTGARPHAPRHETVSTVNLRSSVVLFRCGKTEFLAQIVKNFGGMANVASRAVAAANDIRALGFKGEILIECCNAVNLCLGYAELFRKIRESFLRQVAVVCLNFL